MNDSLHLVTGAPGWFGTRLVDSLLNGLPELKDGARVPGRKIRCLVHRGSDTAALRRLSPDLQIVEGDLTDKASLSTFTEGAKGATLIHGAAVIHPHKSSREFTQVNVDGTQSLLDAAVAAGARRVVYVSSNSPIGTGARTTDVFDESSPYQPYLGYGRSKMLAEKIVNSFHAKGNLETVVIRPPWFYGPGQPPRQTLFFSMIRQGKMPIVGGGENRRSMVYVDNLCQGALLAARTPKANGETYWIADETPYTMNQIVDTVEALLDKEFALPTAHKRMRLPGIFSQVAWLVDTAIQAIGLYHQKIHVLSEMNKTIACSIDKAKRELGYAPSVALEEGMRRSITWILAQGTAI